MRHAHTRILSSTLLAALLFVVGTSPTAQEKTTLTETPLVRAMTDEMNRTAQKLKLEGYSTPYYVAYTVVDTSAVHCAGQDGGLLADDRARARLLYVDVRTGDYQMDSSHTDYVGVYPTSIPIDDDYRALRRAMWLASDGEYKRAVESLEKKRARELQRPESDEDVASFSQQDAPAKVVPAVAPDLEDVECADAAQTVSATLAEFDGIDSAEVTIEARASDRYLVTTEGALGRQPELVARVGLVARTRLEDGTAMEDFVSFEAESYNGLPDISELEEAARNLARRLQKKAAAEKADRYNGPVLFEGRAAAQLLRMMLSRRLSGTPPETPVTIANSPTPRDRSLRIGRQILPEAFSVIDDPTADRLDGIEPVGSYAFDHQGVLPESVRLVADGRVETLLMSRKPNSEIATSNGHGRLRGMSFRGTISNLLVRAEGGKSRAELEKLLVERARREGLEHAYVVSLLDDDEITAASSSSSLVVMRGGGGNTLLPLVVHRINLDGDRETVRNVEVVAPLIRDLRHIVAWGDEPNADHALGIRNPGPGYFSPFSVATPSTVVAPDLMLEEVEIRSRPADGRPYEISAPMPPEK